MLKLKPAETKPTTPIGKSGYKWKTAQIVNISGSRWAAAL
jgi:hypothetical protein